MIRHLPNMITVLRLILVGPFIWVLLGERYGAALGLIFIMGLSDGLDGFLAKRFRWQTTLGAYLDPIADKTMLVSAYATLGWLGLVPLWLVAIIILRDLIILGGAVVYQIFTHHLSMHPSYLSKLNTVAQIILVLAVLVDQVHRLPAWVLTALVVCTLVTTVTSGAGYVVEWSRRAQREVGHGSGGDLE